MRPALELPDGALDSILAEIVRHRGIDFRDHRRESVERGVYHRLMATGVADVRAYQRILADDVAEVTRLVEAVVVPFTGFFRDPTVFEALASRVIPDLARATTGILRAWAVGVATGEEAWSLAMTFASAAPSVGMRGFEVIASDVDERSLETAARGRYSRASCEAVGAERVRQFFEPLGEEGRVVEALRPHVRFERHDIMGTQLAPRSAVIASFQLVLFRNVQIYFERRLQRKAMERLRSVLQPGGALVLGSTEVIPEAMHESFESYPGLDPRLCIYRRRGAA